MPQPVASRANLAPWLIGAKRNSIFPESYGGFADNEKLPLNSGDGFRIFPESVEIHARNEILDHVDGFRDVAQREAGFPKTQ